LGHRGALETVRADVVARLRARLPEIEKAIFASLRAGMSDPAGSGDAEYMRGLRVAIVAVLDYALMGIEKGEEWSGPIPSAATVQARRAARNGVGLETVLLRYTVGNRLLSGYVMEEVDRFPSQVLRQVLHTQGALVERLMAAVSTEYKLEVERAGRSLDQRRGERVLRLLAGEPLDPGEFDYAFEDAWHLGVIAVGVRAREAVRGLGTGLDRSVLSVARGERTMWAWLGGKSRLSVADIERRLSAMVDMGVSLAVGEPSPGIHGWRLTHQQAQAALLVALHRPRGITRYVEDMLLAAALQDETLATSLQEIYMSPLAGQRDSGSVLRETLRVYFDVTGNAATAAVRLKVDRHTVERRLQKIEERLGRLFPTCQAELEVALRLHELGAVAGTDSTSDAVSRSPRDAD
jgi:PucR C-terminal helix-turn-helix domain/GGDEF-like domain